MANLDLTTTDDISKFLNNLGQADTANRSDVLQSWNREKPISTGLALQFVRLLDSIRSEWFTSDPINADAVTSLALDIVEAVLHSSSKQRGQKEFNTFASALELAIPLWEHLSQNMSAAEWKEAVRDRPVTLDDIFDRLRATEPGQAADSQSSQQRR